MIDVSKRMFSAKKILSCCGAIFSDPPQKTQYYYDLKNKRWLEVTPIKRLPYDLCLYRVKDEPDEDQVLVTCSDSYLLFDNTEQIPHEELWRNNLAQKSNIDVYYEGKWVQGEVAWTKEDIIPGVLNVSHHNSAQWIGYFYRESRALAPFSTYTVGLTQVELEQKRKNDLIHVEQEKVLNVRIAEWKSRLLTWEYQNKQSFFRFIDSRSLYKSFNKGEIPYLLISEGCLTKELPLPEEEWHTLSPLQKCYIWLAAYSHFEVVYIQTSGTPIEGTFTFKEADAFFNIKVQGASFARLKVSNECKSIELSKNNQGEFELSGATLETPLFRSVSGAKLFLETDGKRVIYSMAIMASQTRRLWGAIKNEHAVSWLADGHVVLAGHLWMPSYIVREEDLISPPMLDTSSGLKD